MKILIDSNVLISAALSRKGTPYQAFVKAVSYPNHAIICEQNIDEMRRIFNRKFPTKIPALESFLALAITAIEVVPVPLMKQKQEAEIRDVKDRPILRAAIAADADILLTGDKDFLESGVERPEAMTPAEFMRL